MSARDVDGAGASRRRRIAAIILAAGYSSRMKGFKPLLPLNGMTALERAIRLFQAAGIEEIYAVLGHRAEEARPVAESAGAHTVLNPHFDEGMFSSVRAGEAALPAGIDGCFVLPVDTPLVRAETIGQMAAAFDGGECGVLYPEFEGRRGHPPLIARTILRQAKQSPGPLSALLAANEGLARDVAVADEAIHLDMDTEDDYAWLRDLAETRDIPSAAECEGILALVSAPERLVDHSRAVAATAVRLAAALRERGAMLDLKLVRAGALLHDVAKGKPHHAESGAAYLRSLGFPKVGAVVASHMDLDFSREQLDEAAIVFLADKLTRGTGRVSVEERFEGKLERFRDDPEALAAARRRLATARAVVAAHEARLGRSLGDLLGDIHH